MIKKLGLVALGVCFSVSAAQAGMIEDTISHDQVIAPWLSGFHYTHDLNDDGFVLGSALSGTIEIQISDDTESYEFGEWFGDLESVVFVIEEFDLDSGGFSFGSTFINDLEVEALAAINADGFLDVSLYGTGDFYIGDSILKVVTAAVPEPGTLGLFALGLAGLGFARRKTKA